MKVTIKQINDLNSPINLSKILPEDSEVSLVDILKTEGIEKEKLISVVLELMPRATQDEFARWCALQVIGLWSATDMVKEYLETGNKDLIDVIVVTAKNAWEDAVEADDKSAKSAARTVLEIIVYSREDNTSFAEDAFYVAKVAADANAWSVRGTEGADAGDAAWENTFADQVQKLISICGDL